MQDIETEKKKEVGSIAVINQFGTALVSSKNLSEIFELVGEAVHTLLPKAMLYTSKTAHDESYMQGTWQHGFDRYLETIKTIFGIDLFEKKFSLSGATSDELTLYRNGKLYHFEDGLYNLCVRTVPKLVCHAIEKVLSLGAAYAIGFAWNNKHYGALVILLPKGIELQNAEVIETIVHLGSVAFQRVLAEDAIKQSETKYRTLVEHSHQGIGISKRNRIIFANESLLKILGFDSLEEIVKIPLIDFIATESKDMIVALLHDREQNRADSQEFDYKIIRKDGQKRDISIKSSEIVLNGEKCIQSSFIDITELKLADKNRNRMQKLEALGILAGGIAHEFNNLFMGIFGFIECAKGKIQQTAAIEDLEKALNCMDRARALTSRLITFSKGGAPILEHAPLFPFAADVLKTTINGSPVSYKIEKDHDLWQCLYDKEQLRQVLTAIVQNAVEAMPAGGDLLFSATNFPLPNDNCVGLHEGNYLRLSIADHGVGIPEKKLPHIFEPFFSTKPKGIGLNLAIAHSVLKRQGGSIEVESVLSRGTTFHLYLKAEKK